MNPPVECVTAYALHGTVIFLGPRTKLAYKYWRDRRRADVFPNRTKMRSTTVFLVTIVLIAMVELSETRGRLEVFRSSRTNRTKVIIIKEGSVDKIKPEQKILKSTSKADIPNINKRGDNARKVCF